MVTPDAVAAKSLFGPFAGYYWTGHVRSVSAVVVVPRVAAASPVGSAGTWIGATGRIDPETLNAPFFQVGVNEQRTSAPHRKHRISYYAFWSSTALGFHPRRLFFVKPGDALRLSMTLANGRWRILATDETASVSATVTRRSGASYTSASWMQEDVASNDAGAQAPYPQIDPPRFAHVQAPKITRRRSARGCGVI